MVPSVRISSAEKLRREKEVGVWVRSMEATGVRVFDDEEEEETELRLKLRRKENERLFEEEVDAETAESLLETAARGEGGHETGEGGTEPLLSYSLGVVVVIETGVAVPGVEEAEEEDEGSRESLLGFDSEEEEQTLAESKMAK